MIALALFCSEGCAPCDPDRHVPDYAGDDAIDCGFAALGESREAVLQCGLDAQAAGTSAYGGWQVMGIDSEVRRYFAIGGAQDWLLGYDGGIHGDAPRLSGWRCTSELRRGERSDELVCEGGPFETLCD